MQYPEQKIWRCIIYQHQSTISILLSLNSLVNRYTSLFNKIRYIYFSFPCLFINFRFKLNWFELHEIIKN